MDSSHISLIVVSESRIVNQYALVAKYGACVAELYTSVNIFILFFRMVMETKGLHASVAHPPSRRTTQAGEGMTLDMTLLGRPAGGAGEIAGGRVATLDPPPANPYHPDGHGQGHGHCAGESDIGHRPGRRHHRAYNIVRTLLHVRECTGTRLQPTCPFTIRNLIHNNDAMSTGDVAG